MTTAPNTDEAWLAELREGSDEAFAQLYRAYFGMIHHLVINNSGSEADAQDIFQDAVVVLYEKARDPEFVLSAALKTYLYSICRNLWLKRLRNRQKKEKVKWIDYEPRMEVDVEPEPDMTERQQSILNTCLEKLGDPCKTLLVEFYYHKTRMEEIARKLNYANAATAKNQKYKCLQRLRKMALIA
ncbi:MAG: RNA polymerase sigma factor [Salibacteraceae bacterium]